MTQSSEKKYAMQFEWFFMALLLGMLFPTKAFAWTESRIESVTADVYLEPDTTAHVFLQLKIDVSKGWLERIDLPGFSPVLGIDPSINPTLIDEERKWYPVKVESPHQHLIQVFFTKKKKPKRGKYNLAFAFSTQLDVSSSEQFKQTVFEKLGEKKEYKPDQTKVISHWLFPSWDNNLNNITIRFHFPQASQGQILVLDSPTLVQTSNTQEENQTILTWKRHHLPRTIPWPLWMEIKKDFFDPNTLVQLEKKPPNIPTKKIDSVMTGDKPVPPNESTVEKEPPFSEHFFSWITFLLALFSTLSIVFFHSASKNHFVKEKPLLPFSSNIRIGFVIAAAFFCLHQQSSSPLLVILAASFIPLFAAQRIPTQSLLPKPGKWSSPDTHWFEQAHQQNKKYLWISPTMIDGTSLLGLFLCMINIGSFAFLLPLSKLNVDTFLSSPQTLLIPFLMLPFFTATRFHLPANPLTKLLKLHELQKNIPVLLEEINGIGDPELRIHTDVNEILQDARLLFHLDNPLQGIEKTELLCFEDPHFGEKQIWTLSIICQPDSQAHKILTRLLPTTAGSKNKKAGSIKTADKQPIPYWIQKTKVLHGPNQKLAYFTNLTTQELTELPEIFSVIQDINNK